MQSALFFYVLHKKGRDIRQKNFYKTQAKKRKNTIIAYYCTLFENVSPYAQILTNATCVCQFLISTIQ